MESSWPLQRSKGIGIADFTFRDETRWNERNLKSRQIQGTYCDLVDNVTGLKCSSSSAFCSRRVATYLARLIIATTDAYRCYAYLRYLYMYSNPTGGAAPVRPPSSQMDLLPSSGEGEWEVAGCRRLCEPSCS